MAAPKLAPQVGFEPTTLRLTAGCSAVELLRIPSILRSDSVYISHPIAPLNTQWYRNHARRVNPKGMPTSVIFGDRQAPF